MASIDKGFENFGAMKQAQGQYPKSGELCSHIWNFTVKRGKVPNFGGNFFSFYFSCSREVGNPITPKHRALLIFNVYRNDSGSV
jgi:hypothetical protein